MLTLPIMDRNQCDRTVADSGVLTLRYMEDFSVIGLRVHGIDSAIQVLAENRYAVHPGRFGFTVRLDNAGQIPLLADLLLSSGVDCCLTDMVEQIYQG